MFHNNYNHDSNNMHRTNNKLKNTSNDDSGSCKLDTLERGKRSPNEKLVEVNGTKKNTNKDISPANESNLNGNTNDSLDKGNNGNDNSINNINNDNSNNNPNLNKADNKNVPRHEDNLNRDNKNKNAQNDGHEMKEDSDSAGKTQNAADKDKIYHRNRHSSSSSNYKNNDHLDKADNKNQQNNRHESKQNQDSDPAGSNDGNVNKDDKSFTKQENKNVATNNRNKKCDIAQNDQHEEKQVEDSDSWTPDFGPSPQSSRQGSVRLSEMTKRILTQSMQEETSLKLEISKCRDIHIHHLTVVNNTNNNNANNSNDRVDYFINVLSVAIGVEREAVQRAFDTAKLDDGRMAIGIIKEALASSTTNTDQNLPDGTGGFGVRSSNADVESGCNNCGGVYVELSRGERDKDKLTVIVKITKSLSSSVVQIADTGGSIMFKSCLTAFICATLGFLVVTLLNKTGALSYIFLGASGKFDWS